MIEIESDLESQPITFPSIPFLSHTIFYIIIKYSNNIECTLLLNELESQVQNVLPFNHHVTIHLIDMRIVHIQLISIQ